MRGKRRSSFAGRRNPGGKRTPRLLAYLLACSLRSGHKHASSPACSWGTMRLRETAYDLLGNSVCSSKKRFSAFKPTILHPLPAFTDVLKFLLHRSCFAAPSRRDAKFGKDTGQAENESEPQKAQTPERFLRPTIDISYGNVCQIETQFRVCLLTPQKLKRPRFLHISGLYTYLSIYLSIYVPVDMYARLAPKTSSTRVDSYS